MRACLALIAGAALGIDLPFCACALDGGQMAMLGEECQIGGGLALRENVFGHLAGGGVSAPDTCGFSTLGALLHGCGLFSKQEAL